MAFNVLGPYDALVSLVDGLTAMTGDVSEGSPESIETHAAAEVLVGGFPEIVHKTVGVHLQREQHYWVSFFYSVEDDERTAERTIAALIDQFLTAWQNDITLGGTCHTSSVLGGLADDPNYRQFNGPEYRAYPLLVSVTQRQTQ